MAIWTVSGMLRVSTPCRALKPKVFMTTVIGKSNSNCSPSAVPRHWRSISSVLRRQATHSSSHNLTKPFPKASILSCRTIRSYCPLASSPLRKGSISSNSPAAGWSWILRNSDYVSGNCSQPHTRLLRGENIYNSTIVIRSNILFCTNILQLGIFVVTGTIQKRRVGK